MVVHSVSLLEEALHLAQRHGYTIRQEWLGERGGGACRIGTQRLLFVDLSLTAQEQLQVVVNALKRDPHLAIPEATSPHLRRLLDAD
ncbi:MAG: hypothetical protein KatS3mg111_4144 [Pirellulaceae bacterium]|nr:MAG: hypothetical protein KatS3mg111_4144 [Pirellulaceae bacterium]